MDIHSETCLPSFCKVALVGHPFLHLLIVHTRTVRLSSVVGCLILLSTMVGLATCPGSFSCDNCKVLCLTLCTAHWIMTAWVMDSDCGWMHCVALAKGHYCG
jgi:hypothetical protein